MLTEPSKIFVRASAVAVPLAILYAVAGRDRTGVMLLVVLFAVGLLAALSVLAGRETDLVPLDAPDDAQAETGIVPLSASSSPTASPLVAAASVGLIAVSLAAGPAFFVAGAVAGVAALVWWAADALGEHRSHPVNLMPVAVPVVVLFVVVSVVFFMSRILLAVPEQASTVIALLAATLILFGGAGVAARPSLPPSRLVAILTATGAVLLAGGVAAAAVGERKEEKPPSVAAAAAPKPIVARNIAFTVKQLTLSAGKPADLKFTNDDKNVPHNVAIYTNQDAAQVVFRGDVVVGPGTKDYKFTAPPAGAYFFRCDVHPNMNGQVTTS